MHTNNILENEHFLLNEAKRLLSCMPSAEEVVLLQTTTEDSTQLYYYYCMSPNRLAPEEEDKCIQKMKSDGHTHVINILCMSNITVPESCVPLEVPCYTLRKKIRRLDPRNDDAYVYLWGDIPTPNGVRGFKLIVVDTPAKKH